jgi:preprotein translocase subunit SecF
MLRYRKYFYTLSALLVVASIISLVGFGLNFGIDFTGGSLMEVKFSESAENATTTLAMPTHAEVRGVFEEFDIGEVVVQGVGEDGFIMRFQDVNEDTHNNVLDSLGGLGVVEEIRFESVGPIIGEETKRKSAWAIALVLAMILIYVAWAFRKVSFPLSSWKYGVIALITLFHDIIITIGIFSLIGHFFNIEVGVPFVAALLTILGYSVNDTIVIFDRVRENIVRAGNVFEFANIINKSVSETYVRSINTSLTTLSVLLAVYLFGGATVQYFVLTLIIGIIIGTYSSLFVASPLLSSWTMLKRKGK